MWFWKITDKNTEKYWVYPLFGQKSWLPIKTRYYRYCWQPCRRTIAITGGGQGEWSRKRIADILLPKKWQEKGSSDRQPHIHYMEETRQSENMESLFLWVKSHQVRNRGVVVVRGTLDRYHSQFLPSSLQIANCKLHNNSNMPYVWAYTFRKTTSEIEEGVLDYLQVKQYQAYTLSYVPLLLRLSGIC